MAPNGDPLVKTALAIPEPGALSTTSSAPPSPLTPPSPTPSEISDTVRRQQAKYKHIFAIHAHSRTSTLSRDAPTTPSFLGFRNLMVLVLSAFLH